MKSPRVDHISMKSINQAANSAIVSAGFDRILPRIPKLEWGAHAPRVRFSAPSRKTVDGPGSSECSRPPRAQNAGREARPTTPGAGVLPNFGIRVSMRSGRPGFGREGENAVLPGARVSKESFLTVRWNHDGFEKFGRAGIQLATGTSAHAARPPRAKFLSDRLRRTGACTETEI